MKTIDIHHLLFKVIAFAIVYLSICIGSQANAAKDPFVIDDYFKLKRVMELALSSDGEMIAYVVQSQSLDENKSQRAVLVSETSPEPAPLVIDELQAGSGVSWIPNTHELSYLKTNDGKTQLYSFHIATKTIHQHSDGAESVTAYKFAPDGKTIALLTQGKPDEQTEKIHSRIHYGDKGVVLDSEYTILANFVYPESRDFSKRRITENDFHLISESFEPISIKIPGSVERFYWSSDSSKISITYSKNITYESGRTGRISQLAVFDVATRTFQALSQSVSKLKDESELRTNYFAGAWAPNTHTAIISRISTRGAFFVNKHEWALVDFNDGNAFDACKVNWRRHRYPHADMLHPNDFILTDRGDIYSDKTIRAHKSLYNVTGDGLQKAAIVENVDGAISHFQFSRNFDSAVFVNESPARAPEMFIWRKGKGVRQLSNINRELSEKAFPAFREITWTGKDGLEIQGWLLLPQDQQANQKPWPMLTFAHGGPLYAVIDEFAGYFHGWPYPLEALVQRGIAIFIPNYRGSHTFGVEFSQPSPQDGAPVDDIVTGIRNLIKIGLADPERLAIAGHSHGAWLAPLVMTREKIFQVGSFAEVMQNALLIYMMTPDSFNRIFHDPDTGFGESLYDNPQRYIDLSADLHFQGLNTAVLFEAGSEHMAIPMMGSPKAAKRAGMPTEFVVYPKTAHNPTLPSIQMEIASRNLDWFRFWLQSYEDPDLDKEEQYARWRKMRGEQCERLSGTDAPWYCRTEALH